MISRARSRTPHRGCQRETAMGGQAHRGIATPVSSIALTSDARWADVHSRRERLVGLVHRHFDKIKTAAFGQHQPLRPAEIFASAFS
jgi:hypothetical protein